jgi:hypothetical protein
MPPVGFEPTISVLERAKTVRALDRAPLRSAGSLNESDYCKGNIDSHRIFYQENSEEQALRRYIGIL